VLPPSFHLHALLPLPGSYLAPCAPPTTSSSFQSFPLFAQLHTAPPTHLDSSHQNVSVMRESRRERRAVVEGVLRLALALSDALLERINVLPVLEDELLFR
jgi:hypothetical protein